MKKLFLAVALLATSMVASAQFAAGNGGGSMSSSSASEHASFFVQYNSFGVGEYADYLDDIDAENEKLNGFSVGFNKAFSVTSSVPLFVEVGAGLTYAWAKFSDEEDSRDCYYGCGNKYDMSGKSVSQHLMINVPVNLMYKFQLPNSSVTVEPYVGINLKGHILGRERNTLSFDACCDPMDETFEYMKELADENPEDFKEQFGLDAELIAEGKSISNYFDKKDMGGKKYVASRFNIGWQIGANVDFGQAFVGISYGSDFNKYAKWGGEEWKFNAFNVTVGLRF